MQKLSFHGRWVVLTGASAGLGEQLARQLVIEHGAKLFLVARRGERLAKLQAELLAHPGAEVVIHVDDLADAAAPQRIFAAATAGRNVYAVISNAATYWFGRSQDMTLDAVRSMVQVNALSPMALIYDFLPHLQATGGGGILVITSIAGLLPSPYQAVYGGTKAMLQTFTHNLYHELGGPRAQVAISVCSPGGMWTEMMSESAVGQRVRQSWLFMASMMKTEDVARAALRGFELRRYLIIPGWFNQVIYLAGKLLPRHYVGEGNARLYRLPKAQQNSQAVP